MALYVLVLLISTAIMVNTEESTCPSDMVLYSTEPSCLKYHAEAKTFSEAREICKTENGDLVTIKTADKGTFLNSVVSNGGNVNVWIGIQSPDKDGNYFYLDQKPIEMSSWAPDTFDGKGCATRLHIAGTIGWNPRTCDSTYHFVCEADVLRCDPGWIKIPGHDACLKVVKSKRNTFKRASEDCKRMNADLAVRVETKSERRLVFANLRFRASFWIGIHRVDGNFVTVNGATLGGNPPWKRRGPAHHCISMKRKGWYSKRCNKRLPYVCEKPL